MKKKILIITTRPILPLDGGDKVRIYYLSKELSKFFELDLIYAGPKQSQKIIEDTKIFNSVISFPIKRVDVLRNLLCLTFSKIPFQTSFFVNNKLKNKIKENVHMYDYILPHLFRSAVMVPDSQNDKVIFEACDSIGLAISRIKKIDSLKTLFFKIDEKRIKQIENYFINKYEKNIFINKEDSDYLELNKKNNIKIITNGKFIEKIQPVFLENFKSDKILFIGNMSTYPNKQAVEFLIDFIKVNTKYKLVLAGKGSNKYRNFSNVISIDNFENLSKLNNLRIFAGIAPMFLGSGVQNKILDYLNLSIPCLATPVGASGLHNENPLITFNDQSQLLDKLDKLKLSYEYYNQISDKGVKYLNKHHSWESIGKLYADYISQ